MNGGKRREETSPGDNVQLTLRLPPVVHYHLEQVRDQTGKSLNTLIVEACIAALAPPGGASKIARVRRRLVPRPHQAQAALSFLLSYIGRVRDAQKLWPEDWGDFPGTGNREDLVSAGGLLAIEFDAPTLIQGGRPSGVHR